MPKTKILTYAGLSSAALLASLPVFFTISPVLSTAENASAAEDFSDSGNSQATVNVRSALAIKAQDITINATPSVAKNTFITTKATINVRNTGSSGGYHLIMSSKNNGALKNEDTETTINTFSSYSKTGTAMRSDTTSSWGYTTSSVTGTNAKPSENNSADYTYSYYPIPTSSTKWQETSNWGENQYAFLKNTTDYTNQADGDDTTISFAFAIGPDVVSGTYTDTIVYTAIANKDNRTLFDMETMQDLAKYDSACANTPTPAVRTGDTPDTAVAASMDKEDFLANYAVGQSNTDKIPTVTLTDTRDNNTYQVKKLADGNCWMTESLKIAGTDEDNPITLTPADSNVLKNFDLKFASSPYVNDPDSETTGTVTGQGFNGNYLYNFVAATAGYDFSSLKNNENSPQDICPKGWHLPNWEGNASWDKLLNADNDVYEVFTGKNKYSAEKVNWGIFTDDEANVGIGIASQNPIGLSSTGHFAGTSQYNKNSGNYWTRTRYDDENAGNLWFNEYGGGGKGGSPMFMSRLAIRCVSE